MIVVHKKLIRFVPYRIVWFPTASALRAMANEMPFNHLARVECADSDVSSARCTVEHHLSLTFEIDLTLSLQSIFENFSTSARRRIRAAERLGNRIRIRRYSGESENIAYLEEFIQLFNDLVRHKGGALPRMSHALANSYFPHSELLLVDLDGMLICAHLNARDPEAGKTRLLYTTSRRFENPEASRMAGILNVYLHWYEMQAYRNAGFTVYDFGGVSPVDDLGINRFKLQFGPKIVRQHSYMFAGMPTLWRGAFSLFTSLTRRGRRRRVVERAGDRWKEMPLDHIQRLIEHAT